MCLAALYSTTQIWQPYVIGDDKKKWCEREGWFTGWSLDIFVIFGYQEIAGSEETVYECIDRGQNATAMGNNEATYNPYKEKRKRAIFTLDRKGSPHASEDNTGMVLSSSFKSFDVTRRKRLVFQENGNLRIDNQCSFDSTTNTTSCRELGWWYSNTEGMGA